MKLNFQNATQFEYPVIAAGDYPVIVESIINKPSKNGDPMWTWKFSIDDEDLEENGHKLMMYTVLPNGGEWDGNKLATIKNLLKGFTSELEIDLDSGEEDYEALSEEEKAHIDELSEDENYVVFGASYFLLSDLVGMRAIAKVTRKEIKDPETKKGTGKYQNNVARTEEFDY